MNHRPGKTPEGGRVRPDIASHDERVRALHDSYLGELAAMVPAEPPLTDAERYRWIRANRGSTLITDALLSADFDSDFDAQIDAAVRAHRAGRHLPLPVKPQRQMHGRRRTD